MTAKNKDDFLFNLHNELHRIGVDDNADIVADFEEHFRASAEQGFSEEETCAKLGDVKEIARSYIDIESTKINSIVANAIEDSRPHVSLKKPGRSASVPVAEQSFTTAPAEQSFTTASLPAAEPATAEQPEQAPQSIREMTPEHITEEQPAPSVSVPQPEAPKSEPVPEPVQSVQREKTPEHINPEQPAPSKEKPEHISDSDIEIIPAANDNSNNAQNDPHKGTIPTQNETQKRKGFDWSQIKGRSPRVHPGKLIGMLCIDIFVLSWALPALAWLIYHFLVYVVIGLFQFGFSQFVTESMFHFISRIFLGTGLVSLAALAALLFAQMVKGFIKIIKNAVIGHVKAIYDL